MKLLHTLIIGFFSGTLTLSAQQFEYFNGHKAHAGEVVYKLKTQPALKSAQITPHSSDEAQFSTLLLSVNAQTAVLFPNIPTPDANCKNCVDLSRVYKLTYDPQKISLTRIVSLLRRFSFIEYAEPLYVSEFFFTPNDPKLGTQWYMSLIQLFDAWDVSNGQGSEDVVIGVVDAGTEITHSDLANQIAYNDADPINGIDDDNDGFVDNYYGWNFGLNTNNPNPGAGVRHGTNVAGLCAAEVNNGIGIAGTGFRCKFLPIRIADANGAVVREYEGVIYAALHGCKIINCSWGSTENSQFGKDVVQFATFNCNALVVAAAGNDNWSYVYYPASYPFVLSVSATVQDDTRWVSAPYADGSRAGGNYNYFVNICGPTTGYLSTDINNNYIDVGGGTSFATPIVSGVAGLVKAKFPHYTAAQVGEQVRVNADDIYNRDSNSQYRDRLGKGRVNALKALTNTTSPSIRIDSISSHNLNGSNVFARYDTLEVTLTCTNYLAPISSTVTLALTSSGLSALNSVTVSTMGTLETKTFCFRFRVTQNPSADAQYTFKLAATSSVYNDYEYFYLNFNQANYNFTFGNFAATATGNSTVGIADVQKPSGYGIQYAHQPNMIYDAGLLLATNETATAAQIRGNSNFLNTQIPRLLQSDSTDILIQSGYKTANLAMNINQYIYGWEGIDALIYEYRITNTGTEVRENIRAGIFANWIIGFQQYNSVRYLSDVQCAVISGIDEGGFLVGIMPLHYHESGLFAFDSATEIEEIPSEDALSSQGIWKLLTSTKTTAGIGFDTDAAGNVSTTSWCKIGSIEPQKSDTIRYAIIAGKTFNEIRNTAQILKNRYVTDTASRREILPCCETCKCGGENEDPRREIVATGDVQNAGIQLRQTPHYVELQAQHIGTAHIVVLNSVGVRVSEQHHDFSKSATYIATETFAPGVYSISVHNKNTIQTFKIVITN
ncbi:MAG: S8 family serine peptidase [Bacteroidales bacterium]|jgi:hypothetical protein|nr:S8 family serine peptidase [Bacteroidales bacterium]